MAAKIVMQICINISVCIAMASFYSPLMPCTSAGITTDYSYNTTLSALLALKHSISLDPSSFLASWNSSTDYCTWHGVLCINGTHDVFSLQLASSQLTGTLPPLLGDLIHLSNLSCYNNSLYGPIPPQLGKLTALIELDLSLNNFTGPIPSSLANCTLLEALALEKNLLSSHFPAFISSLVHLNYVDFSQNLITGEIPPDIGLLTNLSVFQVYGSFLTGGLPASITNCTKLVWLNLDNNRLSGPIPPEWSKLEGSLEQLVLAVNSFSGSIPHSLSNCTKLQILSLQINALEGEIPESLGRLAGLQTLNLYNNTLSGTIPTSIMNCTQLSYLELGQNNLWGSIPQEIGQLTQLQYLHLSLLAKLSGGIPHSIGQCKQIQHLHVENTMVGGSLPMSLYDLTNMQYLKLSSSNLSGSLDERIGNLTQLLSLRLGSNSFEGQIPTALGMLKSLQNLELQENSFQGPIPPQLSGCTALFNMDLSHNLLSGAIPPELGQLYVLSDLYLQYNQLSGQIPEMFGSMMQLQSLNLAGNLLSGAIPASLTNLSTLNVLLDVSFNTLSGALPASLGSMEMLVTLRASGNKFTGPIPSSLGNCQGMQVLDLSINQLQSEIPSALGDMRSLQYLNLSQNNLSGSLPSSLGTLPDLVSLNVSYNSLQGMIPAVGIYEKSSSASFVGNPGLCGHPLPTSCSSSAHSSHHSKLHHIAIIALLCAVGGVIITAIIFAYLCWRLRAWKEGDVAASSNEPELMDESNGAGHFDIQPPHYKAWTADEIRAATNGFDTANLIGAGGSSECYRGVMMDGKGNIKKVVAVKRLRVAGGVAGGAEAKRSLANEMKTLCKVRHRNLVRVEGYCLEGGEVALVMELIGKGNLHDNLHSLSWQERVNVAADVAEGLVYLHDEYVQPIIHCDVKPTNILLDFDSHLDIIAKLSDFGIAKLVDSGHATQDLSNSQFRGTIGYAAPEYGSDSRISTKCDVYSYGVLLFELVTGLSPICPQFQQYEMSPHSWIKLVQNAGRTREVLDTYMQKAMELEPSLLQEAEHFLQMAVDCTSQLPKTRPTMRVMRDYINSLKLTRSHKLKWNFEQV